MKTTSQRLARSLHLMARLQAVELALTELKQELREEVREARDGVLGAEADEQIDRLADVRPLEGLGARAR